MPTFVYSKLKHAAFPDSSHPDALVHVPDRFVAARPFGVVVYLHGFENCIENVAAPPPGIHDPPHPTANLIAQLDSVDKNAILLLPEAGYHVRSADGGQLGERDGFLRLFREVLARLRLDSPQLAAIPDDVTPHLVLISHSGGYRLAAQLARQGGLGVQELALLDSLYGSIELYDAIADEMFDDYAAGRTARRLVNLYRPTDTAKNSRAQAERLREQLVRKGLDEKLLYFDDSEEPVDFGTLDAALSHLVTVKRVPTEHSDFGATYVAALLRTSFLP
jgi:pimeloyl-ACP methyl ester carboxylesterase